MKPGYIYKIISPSGKIYIGSTVDFKKRLEAYLRLNCHQQTRLYRSFLKYGVVAHKIEIIERPDGEELKIRESYWGDHYCVLGPNGLNCNLPKADGSFDTTRKKTREKLSTAKKKLFGINSPLFGRKRPQEACDNMRAAQIGNKNRAKVVLSLRDGIFYDSAKETAMTYGIPYPTMQGILKRGRIKSPPNFIYA